VLRCQQTESYEIRNNVCCICSPYKITGNAVGATSLLQDISVEVFEWRRKEVRCCRRVARSVEVAGFMEMKFVVGRRD
jgi:hypothetical protein